ncbi:hypothetical protein B0T13DRAFT_303475 [Neurospora crassa]|nr:hypothetical protein B0T13DRAFT_303475 [Neurospora crassa]
MTQQQQTRPELLKGVTKKSKYMRFDYERYSDSVPSVVPAGHGSIGKVEVDCRFLFSKSKWGYMGLDLGNESAKFPAGILYLDLVFRQPQDCKLQSATVAVIIGKDEDTTGQDGSPVMMTEFYGPGQLRGPRQLVQSRRVKQFMPHVEVMGYGAGGAGISTEENRHITDRWGFSGHLRSDPGSLTYNRLEWDLDECFLEERPSHGNVFHTAFVIGHNAKAFHMTVEVKGKLARKRDQFKHTMNKLKFGGNKARPHDTAAVKFQWTREYSSSVWLDSIAQGLPYAMEEENMRSIPIEVPQPQPASFRPAMDSEPATGPTTSALAPQRQNDTAAPVTHNDADDQMMFPRLQTTAWPRLTGLSSALPHLTPSTPENMARAAGLELAMTSTMPQQSENLEFLERSEFSSGTTLVESSQESESGGESSPTCRVRRSSMRTQFEGSQPGDCASKGTKGKEVKMSIDEPKMKAGFLLGLFCWLQGGLTVWDLFAAMLGFAAYPDPSVWTRDQRDPMVSEVRQIEPATWGKKPWSEDFDTDTPVMVANGTGQRWKAKEEWENNGSGNER